MRTVLIVERDQNCRQSLAGLFNSQPDFELVGEVGSLADSVSLVAEYKPDLVLLDEQLPDSSGPDAAQAILFQAPETIIVFLSEKNDDDNLFAAVRAGAKGYLLKGLPPDPFLAALRGLDHGQAPISRRMAARILDEFSRMSAAVSDNKAIDLLTSREIDVLQELTKGLTNREIATSLYISEYTVKNHLHSILDKLGVSNRREAVKIARKYGLFDTG
jgi:DNA-binding NarL/FixJ family response regulator